MDKYTSKTGHQSGTQPLPHINHPTTNPKLDKNLIQAFSDFYEYMYEPNIIKAAEEYSKKTIYKNLKQTILSDLLAIVGEDEPTTVVVPLTTSIGNTTFAPTPHALDKNRLRAELRTKIRAYIGVES